MNFLGIAFAFISIFPPAVETTIDAAKKACLSETRSFLSTSEYAYLVLSDEDVTRTNHQTYCIASAGHWKNYPSYKGYIEWIETDKYLGDRTIEKMIIHHGKTFKMD